MKIQNIIIALLVIVILWLSLCNKATIEKPVVVPVSVQKAIVKRDDAYSKYLIDSIAKNVLMPALKEADYWEKQFKLQSNDYSEQSDILNYYVNLKCLDSTGEVKRRLVDFINSGKDAIKSCENTITAKDKVIAGKDAIIVVKDTLINRKQASLELAFSEQDKLQRYINKMQSKRSLYAGITGIGNTTSFINGVGFNLGYRTRKGSMIEVGTLHSNSFNTTQITIGLKKTIFSF